MKRELIAALLFVMAFGTFQLPARADFGVTFGRYDHNHDGRWDYDEFRDANRHYYRHHRGVVIMTDPQLRTDFNRLDTDNDGFVNMQEVQTYHTWE